MSYEVGDKFVIEIEAKRLGDPILYRIKGFNTLVFDDNGLDRLDNYDTDYNEGYEDGLHYAWECAKKIANFNAGEIYARFGVRCIAEVFDEFSASEAENSMIAYKVKQSEIKVGDEVVNSGDKGVVTCVNNSSNACDVIWFDGSVNEELEEKFLRKTGRHYDIKSILEQLKGADECSSK